MTFLKSRGFWILIGGVAVIAVVAIIVLSRFNALIAPKPLEISYSTVQTAMPDGAACAGGSDQGGGVAKEILDLETDIIYVAGGSNPMPDDVWAGYNFFLPILKNSTRNLLFEGSCFFRSPDAAPTCQGDACFTITEIAEHTWLNMTTVAGNECFPDPSGCTTDVVNPGYVSINTIAKCHRVIFNGPTIYELSDGQGNLSVMHATATGTPDLNPTLPEGWTLTARTITEPLVLLPFGGGESCYYNIIRDNLVQSYHQYAYSTATYPPS